MKYLLLTLAICVTMTLGQNTCDVNRFLELNANPGSGFGYDYPRYIGTWERQGVWNGNGFFLCNNNDCQGLRDELVSLSI